MPGLPSDVYPDLQKALGKVLEVRGFALSGPVGDLIRDHVAQLDHIASTASH